jgi:superfamily II DNA helicase RecQ
MHTVYRNGYLNVLPNSQSANFRPIYLLLKNKAAALNVKRVLCCTHSATPIVSQDIIKAFSIPTRNIVRTQSPSIFNHCLDLHVVDSDSDRLTQIITSLNYDLAIGSPYKGAGISLLNEFDSGIIYVSTFENS